MFTPEGEGKGKGELPNFQTQDTVRYDHPSAPEAGPSKVGSGTPSVRQSGDEIPETVEVLTPKDRL